MSAAPTRRSGAAAPGPRASGVARESAEGRLTRLTLFARAAHEPGARRLRVGLLVLPLLLGGLVLAVREIGHVERVLAAEGERVQRVVVYELPVDGELHARTGPGTDVVRLVLHAVHRHGALEARPHVAHLHLRALGQRGALREDLTLALPGSSARVTPEDRDVAIGDPLSVNVDLHGVGVGELVVSLAGIEGADAVAVRIYRRDVLTDDAIARRLDELAGATGVARAADADDGPRRHVTAHVGEIDLLDARPDEQRALLAARWRKLAATRGLGAPLRTLAIALTREADGDEPAKVSPQSLAAAASPAAPAAPGARPPADERADEVVDLLGDEGASWMVHGPCSLRLDARDEPQAELRARVRDAEGDVRSVTGVGELRVAIEEGRLASVELGRGSPGLVGLVATGDGAVEPSAHVVAWRTTAARPVLVDAGTSDLTLRIAARRPVARTSAGEVELSLEATIEPTDAAARGGGRAPIHTTLRATRQRARFARYEGPRPLEAPTESAVFHVLVPAGARVRLAATDGALDVSLAELDPSAPPRPTATFPVERGWKATVETGGEAAGYAPRRPTNADAFPADARLVLHLPRRLVELPTPPTHAPTWRVRRPPSATTRTIAGRVFEPETVAYELELGGDGEPLVLPLRLFASTSLTLVARIDGAMPLRIPVGFVERVTTARALPVEGEVRGVVVLGDDLAPGIHTLTFETAPGEHAWIHLPWAPKARLPGAPPRAPHWIDGDLDD